MTFPFDGSQPISINCVGNGQRRCVPRRDPSARPVVWHPSSTIAHPIDSWGVTNMDFGLTTVWHRIYADFLMPSRLPAYRRLLASFLDAGYAVESIETYWDRIKRAELDPARRVLVLRHDIDTDPATGRRMWEIETELGVTGSFFFRLSTLDVPLMRAIAESGAHASYHYEELATVAKRHHLRSRLDVDRHLGEAREEFGRNLESLRSRTDLPLRIVASHGDFVNRRLDVPNLVILADPDFRRETGIDLEAYDETMMGHVTSRHSDTGHPRYWRPDGPLGAVTRGEPVVYLLVHPRHWRVARTINARDDVARVWENVAYRLRQPPGRT